MADRVCLLRHGIYPGEARLERQAAALRSAGFEVDVICLRPPGAAAFEVVDGVRVHRLPVEHRRAGIVRYLFEYGAFALLAAGFLAVRQLRRRYAVIEVHTMPDFLVFSALVPKLLGARVLLDMHEVVPELAGALFGDRAARRVLVPAIRWTERLAIRFADHVLTVSAPTYDVLVGRGAPPEKLTIVMNVPDEAVFRPQERLGDGDAGGTVVAHGTLLERSGFQTLVAAFALLAPQSPRLRLRIIGGGEYGEPLRLLAQELGVEDRVELRGRVPLALMPSELARADVAVATNEIDAFTDLILPTRLLEYVGLGLPAVTVPSHAVRRYFDESMLGFYESGDPQGLAAAIDSALTDREAALERARRASVWLEEFSWARQREAYLAAVERLRASARAGDRARR